MGIPFTHCSSFLQIFDQLISFNFFGGHQHHFGSRSLLFAVHPDWMFCYNEITSLKIGVVHSDSTVVQLPFLFASGCLHI